MKTFFYQVFALLLVGLFFQTPNANAQCLDWVAPSPSTGWTDFNLSFGGAPCDDGTGCPFNEITDFQVWASEAYSVDGFIAGGSYSFSMCNGSGAGSWVPEFTIIAPSGTVDASGAGDGDGCTITWTASESGTYLIVINEAGNCGIANNTDNGFPALTCNSGAPCDPTQDACNAGILETTGTQVICEVDGTFDLMIQENTDTIPDGGAFGWSFSDVLGGTGAVPNFTITGANPTTTWDSDLGGILSANSLDPLSGRWVIRGVAYESTANPLGTICSTTADSLIVNFTDGGPTVDEVVDNGDNSATVTVSGGTPPYSYEWSDGQTTATATDLATGTYTVLVTDDNGCTAEGSVDVINTAVGEIAELQDLLLAPNPSQGVFNLHLTLASSQDVRVSVLDLTGKSVYAFNSAQTQQMTQQIDLTSLSEGLYLLRIQVGADELTRRIVIAR